MRIFVVVCFTFCGSARNIAQASVKSMQSIGRGEASFWEDFSEGLSSLRISTVAVDPRDARRVYVVAGGVLYRSQDRGEHWKRLLRFWGIG
ncbi:MAG: hypothetical protein AAGJ35_10175, partial [Myxococcota bacterium]